MRIKATVKNDNWFIYTLDKVWTYNDLPKQHICIFGETGAKPGEFYLRTDYTSGHFICIRDIQRIKEVEPFRNTNYRDDVKRDLFERYYPEELL